MVVGEAKVGAEHRPSSQILATSKMSKFPLPGWCGFRYCKKAPGQSLEPRTARKCYPHELLQRSSMVAPSKPSPISRFFGHNGRKLERGSSSSRTFWLEYIRPVDVWTCMDGG